MSHWIIRNSARETAHQIESAVQGGVLSWRESWHITLPLFCGQNILCIDWRRFFLALSPQMCKKPQSVFASVHTDGHRCTRKHCCKKSNSNCNFNWSRVNNRHFIPWNLCSFFYLIYAIKNKCCKNHDILQGDNPIYNTLWRRKVKVEE